MRTTDLKRFILAREAIRIAKEAGKKKPWTRDSILRQYRFCNVHREDDTVTKWIKEHWRDMYERDKDMWFAMSVARAINLPETLVEVAPAIFQMGKVNFNVKLLVELLHKRRDRGEKLWTGAYLVATHGHAMDKSEFVAHYILFPLWKARDLVRPRPGDSLHQFACRARSVKHQGSFIVGQMIADAKYADPILLKASDWRTFAISGPGSRRGLNRVYDFPLDEGWVESQWHEHLMTLYHKLSSNWPDFDKQFHAQDLQNCLCEFDKYERVRLGEGRPRSLYNGR